MRKMSFWAPALLAVFCVSGVLAGEEVIRDGVLHIVNGDKPSEGIQALHFQEAWSAGGEDGEDFFGLISKVLIDEDGTVYLLDTRLSEVPVYSPDGERLDTLSREGEGPGETRMPTNLVFMPDGNLGLVQRYPGKIVKIDRQGNPVGDYEPSIPDAGFVLMTDAFTSGGDQLTVVGMNVKQEGQTKRDNITFVSNFGPDGAETVRFVEQHNVMDFTNFHFDEDKQDEVSFRQVAAGHDGRIYVTMVRNAYEIRVFNPDGSLERIIERQFERRQRTDEEYQEIKDLATAQMARLPGAKFDISHTHRDINSLRIAADGNLWVTTSRSGIDQPEGVLNTFDVFDPDGHFIRQVQVHVEGDGEDDALFFAPGGDAVLVTGFAPALRSLQNQGGSGEDDEEAAPMEVIYLKRAG